MQSSSDSRTAVGTATLAVARGTLRDALGGLRNLAELLHSVRVGPKALTSVLPDVAASASLMRRAVDELLSQVSAPAEFSTAAAELECCFGLRLERLRMQLDLAMSRPLTAKSRLGLEQAVTELSLELDTARGLLELLAEATSKRAVHVRLRELIHESFSGPPSGGTWKRGVVVATLSFERDDVELDVNPRVAITLFALGVELVANSGIEHPCIRVEGRGPHGCSVLIARGPGPTGEEIQLGTRGVIEPTLACVRAAAKLSKVDFEWRTDNPSLRLGFPTRTDDVRQPASS